MSLDTGTNEFTRPQPKGTMSYRDIQNYNVYWRSHPLGPTHQREGDLKWVGRALSASPEDALSEAARRETLTPGKYVVISTDFATISTGTVTHRVVMD